MRPSLLSIPEGGRATLACLLLAVLVAFAVGCGSAGSNGGGDGGNGDGGNGDPSVPAAPIGLEGDSEDSAVDLTWSAAEKAETYAVYRDENSGVDTSGDPLAEEISSTSHLDEEAENGTTYHYVVTAIGEEGGESDPSNEIEKTPFSDPPTRP